ncbi:MAG: patatin-like phospholipase family protein [Chitinispirillaceae bacterium]|nr:patatin-like phospholipase family protein [Chitinispirillaceae bacterium]
MSLKKVLSIDGGGIRGIIPALVLSEIEKQVGKPICRIFDLIAGTSTGGILALGLTVPDESGPKFSAQDLISIYERDGKHIFQSSFAHDIVSVGGIRNEKYPCKGINNILKDYFGSAMLSDVLTDVIITAYETERRIPWFFKSRYTKGDKADKDSYDFLMTDVARATSAAPTYFEPARLTDAMKPDEYYSLVDGGVFANNPAMCAYAECIETNPDCDNILLVSIGTGEYTNPLLYHKIKGWGLANWAQPILDIVFDGVSDTVDYQLHQILKYKSPKSYYRFQVVLPPQTENMDDTSHDNIRTIKLLGESIIRKCENELEQLCLRLKNES